LGVHGVVCHEEIGKKSRKNTCTVPAVFRAEEKQTVLMI
jgi:hypothetical protein